MGQDSGGYFSGVIEREAGSDLVEERSQSFQQVSAAPLTQGREYLSKDRYRHTANQHDERKTYQNIYRFQHSGGG